MRGFQSFRIDKDKVLYLKTFCKFKNEVMIVTEIILLNTVFYSLFLPAVIIGIY